MLYFLTCDLSSEKKCETLSWKERDSRKMFVSINIFFTN